MRISSFLSTFFAFHFLGSPLYPRSYRCSSPFRETLLSPPLPASDRTLNHVLSPATLAALLSPFCSAFFALRSVERPFSVSSPLFLRTRRVTLFLSFSLSFPFSRFAIFFLSEKKFVPFSLSLQPFFPRLFLYARSLPFSRFLFPFSSLLFSP